MRLTGSHISFSINTCREGCEDYGNDVSLPPGLGGATSDAKATSAAAPSDRFNVSGGNSTRLPPVLVQIGYLKSYEHVRRDG